MTKDQVEIGGVYAAKITDKVAPVRIDREHPSGGWLGTNLSTDRQVRIKSPRKLRNRIRVPQDGAHEGNAAPAEETPTEANTTAAPAKVPAKAPQKPTLKRVAKGKPTPRKADAKLKPQPQPDAPARLSCIDAAAKMLAEHKGAMHCKQMVEAMAAKGYWTTPGGRTPHATLYSAITREIAMKGDDSRFRKVERGHFTLRKEG